MLFFLLFIVLVVLAIGAIALSFSSYFTHDEYSSERNEKPRVNFLGLLLGGILLIVAFLTTGLVQIDAGHVGVVRQFGAVTGETMQPGLQWRVPVVNSVEVVDTRVRSVRIEGYTAASVEQQDLFMNLTLNYHIQPDRAPEIIQTVGSDFEQKIVIPRFLDIPKSVTDDYPTQIVLNSRDDIRQKATELLRSALEPYGLVVDNISLENFGYSPEYNQAIEEKQIEQQRVETEKQRLEQAKIAAQTLEEQAKGEANAQVARARGEAESNRLISESLTDQILVNRYIEKLSSNINAMLVPSEGGFILDLGDALTPNN